MADLLDRIADKFVITDNGCWEWTAAKRPPTRKSGQPYGVISVPGTDRKSRMKQAHRVVWELVVGPIPEGYESDHLCGNGLCINPDHLDPVQPRVNKHRSDGFGGINYRKTHCPQGHEYSEANTRNSSDGRRHCRKCDANGGAGRRAARAAAVAPRETKDDR